MNSMTVTLDPRRDQTDPISRPMTPPPMTARDLGIDEMSSAPVESTILPVALSTGTGGRGVTSDPFVVTIFFIQMREIIDEQVSHS